MSRSSTLPAPSQPIRLAITAAIAGLAACAGPATTASTDGNPPPAVAASAASAPVGATTAPATIASAPAPSTTTEAAPIAPDAPTPAAAALGRAESPARASAAPLPDVKVGNIGMHIGGGPNDAPTKEPIKKSVEPHFEAFRACFGELDDKDKGGDFGVDLRIERGGGKANVSHPRTALKGKAFEACVVRTFEAIEFLPPKGGTTTVSYSLRFTPAKGAGSTSRKAPKAPSR